MDKKEIMLKLIKINGLAKTILSGYRIITDDLSNFEFNIIKLCLDGFNKDPYKCSRKEKRYLLLMAKCGAFTISDLNKILGKLTNRILRIMEIKNIKLDFQRSTY